MSERTAKLIAEKLESMDIGQAESDARAALALARTNLDAALEAMAMVRSAHASPAYVRAYTDVMLIGLTRE